jgi:hypothetical protein
VGKEGLPTLLETAASCRPALLSLLPIAMGRGHTVGRPHIHVGAPATQNILSTPPTPHSPCSGGKLRPRKAEGHAQAL